MKTLKNITWLLIFLLMFTNCDDMIIDLDERDRLPAGQAVASIEGLNSLMLQVYERTRSIHENNQICLYKQCGTDIVTSGTHLLDVTDGGMEAMNMYTSNLSALSPEIEDIFNGLIESITACNTVIQYADNFDPAYEEQVAQIDFLKGQAYALRAYVYLEMVTRWENVVIIPNRLEPGEPIRYDVELSGPAEVLELIIADCLNAVDLLPKRSSGLGVGDASQGLAYHLLSKAYMETGDWDLAADAAEAVIADGSYTLQPLDNIFGLDGGKQGEESNEEIILSWIFNPAISNRPQRTMQQYVPLYRLVDGLTTALDQGGRPWSRLSPSEYYWSLFDEEDGRLNEWHKRFWFYNDEPNLPAGKSLGDTATYEDLVAQFGADAGRPLRYLDPTTNKFFEDGTYGRELNDAEGFRNIIVFRLSEAYIIGAEAHWKNGNESRALELINTIRERAYGNTDHNFTSLDQETIIEEHARELGHEGHRWAFMKRLGLLVERTNMYCKDVDGNLVNMQSHHVRWPIPQPFIDLTGVTQNPGYN